jgi:outer membrane protein OmpU
MNKLLTSAAAVVLAIAVATSANAGGTASYSKKAVYSPKYKKAKTVEVSAPAAEVAPAKAAASAGNVVNALGGLEVKLGGFSNFQAGYVDATGALNDGKTRFRNDNEIHVTAGGKTAAGTSYGAVVQLEADTTTSTSGGSGLNADKTYAYLGTSAGRFEMGAVDNAQARLSVNGAKLQRAAGGYTSTDLASAVADMDAADASRLSYYTPKVAGLQLGVSYAPDAGNTGQNITPSSTYNDVVSVGANYDLGLGGTNVKVSGGYEAANDASGFADDYAGWNAGLGFGAAGAKVAGSYGENKFDVSGKTKNWDAGIGYGIGKAGLSVGYGEAKDSTSGDKITGLSVGADYALAPGIVPYVEVNFYENKPAGGASSDATVVLAGTQINF